MVGTFVLENYYNDQKLINAEKSWVAELYVPHCRNSYVGMAGSFIFEIIGKHNF